MQDQTTTTTAACQVAWCDRHQTGHPFDGIDVTRDGALGRTHSADVGYLSNTPGPHGEAWVDVETYETQTKDGSTYEAAHVALSASHIELTADEARRLAAWLQQAAQKLDAILAAS